MRKPDKIDLKISARLKARRIEQGISLRALGEHLGVSQGQIHHYENGADRISGSALVRLAERLGASVSYLVGEVDDPEPTDRLRRLMMVPGAFHMLQAYSSIESEAVRKALLGVAVSTASSNRSLSSSDS